jgi:hypothetical protein
VALALSACGTGAEAPPKPAPPRDPPAVVSLVSAMRVGMVQSCLLQGLNQAACGCIAGPVSQAILPKAKQRLVTGQDDRMLRLRIDPDAVVIRAPSDWFPPRADMELMLRKLCPSAPPVRFG